MDPVLKLWMFENWMADQKDQGELAKNHALFIGSFINPEAVKQLTDNGNKHQSTDEEFEETMKFVKDFNNQPKKEKKQIRKKRFPIRG